MAVAASQKGPHYMLRKIKPETKALTPKAPNPRATLHAARPDKLVPIWNMERQPWAVNGSLRFAEGLKVC